MHRKGRSHSRTRWFGKRAGYHHANMTWRIAYAALLGYLRTHPHRKGAHAVSREYTARHSRARILIFAALVQLILARCDEWENGPPWPQG